MNNTARNAGQGHKFIEVRSGIEERVNINPNMKSSEIEI